MKPHMPPFSNTLRLDEKEEAQEENEKRMRRNTERR